MRLALIIVITFFLWSGSVSLKVKPPTKSAEPTSAVCLDTRNGAPLLQTMSKGTISGIHDNGRELMIGIPGNWADFTSKDKKTIIHQAHCYAKELNRQLQFVHAPKPAPPVYDLLPQQ